MADRAISALTQATYMTNVDLFAISQGGQAKKVTWETFYSYLAEALDGHGGINNVAYTAPTSGSLTGTLTITYADGTTASFAITNGRGITTVADKWAVSASKTTPPTTWYDDPQALTATNKYEWHYSIITFNDNTTLETDKAVVGVYGDTAPWYVWIKYSETLPTSDADISDTPNDWIGIYSGSSSTAPTSYSSYTWFQYKGEKGDTGTSITSVSLYESSGLVDTYRVTFSDGTFTSFNVTNGSSIASISLTDSSGLVDTYTVTLTNGNTTTFQVANGKGISSITEVDVTHAAGHTDVYRINFNDGDTYNFSIYNGANGSGSVSTVDGIQSVNQDVSLLQFGQGAPTTSTQGALKSRYFDQANSILYICVGIDTSGAETTYTWQGAGVTVDNALSTMSTNPVQNAVLTALLGLNPLSTTAQTLTGAVNELNTNKAPLASPTFTGTPKAPTASESTDNTQIATTAFANRAANNAVATYVRPNLLDNWYFAGGGSQLGNGIFPINQRGQTNYSGNGINTIDRWRITNSVVNVYANSVQITLGNGSNYRARFRQLLSSPLPAGTYTLSAYCIINTNVNNSLRLCVSTGDSMTYISPAFSGTTSQLGVISYTFTTPQKINNANVEIITNATSADTLVNLTLVAIKLEVGPTQTLAHQSGNAWILNEIPDYVEQLAKCQRYFERIKGAYSHFGTGFANTTTNVILYVPVKEKAKSPTVTLSGTIYVWQPGRIGDSSATCTNITSYNMENGKNMLYLTGPTSGLTLSTPCGAQFRDSASYIDVSAE